MGKKKKKLRNWVDCLTFLSLDEISKYIQEKKIIQLKILDNKKKEELINGSISSIHKLSTNAYYFIFEGRYHNHPFIIKIKQNTKHPKQRYLEYITSETQT